MVMQTEVVVAEKQQALLGLRIMLEVHRLGLSVAALARQARLPLSTVQKIAAGDGKQPSAWTIVELARALRVSTDYLLGLSDARTCKKN